MPPLEAPKLRRHKASGRAVVTLPEGGKRQDHYLGPWPEGEAEPAPEVRAAYFRLIAEWEARGRTAALPAVRAPDSPTPGPTVDEVILAFWKHAEQHYRGPDGEPTTELNEYKYSLRPLRRLSGDTEAA